jgi:hypothetical protein
MRRRKFLVLLGGTAAAWPLNAHTQQVAGPRRVGLLMAWKESDPEVQGWLAALREALGKLGWKQGQNVLLEFRWAGTDSNLMQQAPKSSFGYSPI